MNAPYLFAAAPPPPRVIPDETGMIFDKAISSFKRRSAYKISASIFQQAKRRAKLSFARLFGGTNRIPGGYGLGMAAVIMTTAAG